MKLARRLRLFLKCIILDWTVFCISITIPSMKCWEWKSYPVINYGNHEHFGKVFIPFFIFKLISILSSADIWAENTSQEFFATSRISHQSSNWWIITYFIKFAAKGWCFWWNHLEVCLKKKFGLNLSWPRFQTRLAHWSIEYKELMVYGSTIYY